MYGAAGSSRLRSYPPRLGVTFQPEAPTSIVGLEPCRDLLPQEYSLMGQHGFGLKQTIGNDRNHHCPSSSCHADIIGTPTSSAENTASMSSGLDQIWRSHKVGDDSYTQRNKATVVSSKSRIKWTQHLHDKFTECVGILGGADKATPKGILRLMGVDGLTIYHVKSHLQKYRVTRFVSDSKHGKLKKPVIDLKTGKQIAETFQMQLDIQMQLHQQLQVQNDLQLKIEEQGRQLKLLLEQRLKQPKERQQQPVCDI